MPSTASLRQMNPSKARATWLGLDCVEDYVPGTFIRIIADNDRWSSRASGRNEVRIKNESRGGYVEITIPRECDLNRKLVALANSDDTLENIVGPMLLEEDGGTDVVCNNAYLLGIPNGAADISTTPLDVTWRWRSPQILPNAAGFSLVTAGEA